MAHIPSSSKDLALQQSALDISNKLTAVKSKKNVPQDAKSNKFVKKEEFKNHLKDQKEAKATREAQNQATVKTHQDQATHSEKTQMLNESQLTQFDLQAFLTSQVHQNEELQDGAMQEVSAIELGLFNINDCEQAEMNLLQEEKADEQSLIDIAQEHKSPLQEGLLDTQVPVQQHQQEQQFKDMHHKNVMHQERFNERVELSVSSLTDMANAVEQRHLNNEARAQSIQNAQDNLDLFFHSLDPAQLQEHYSHSTIHVDTNKGVDMTIAPNILADTPMSDTPIITGASLNPVMKNIFQAQGFHHNGGHHTMLEHITQLQRPVMSASLMAEYMPLVTLIEETQEQIQEESSLDEHLAIGQTILPWQTRQQSEIGLVKSIDASEGESSMNQDNSQQSNTFTTQDAGALRQTDVYQQSIFEQMMHTFRARLRKEFNLKNTSLAVTVNHESLGAVDIKLNVENGYAKAQLRGQTKAMQQLLAQNRHSISQILKDNDLKCSVQDIEIFNRALAS